MNNEVNNLQNSNNQNQGNVNVNNQNRVYQSPQQVMQPRPQQMPQQIQPGAQVNPNQMQRPVVQNQGATNVAGINQNINPSPSQINNYNAQTMAAVSNLNKEEAMEEALSHTTQYSPFEVPRQEVNQEVKKGSSKGAYIFIGIIFLIMLLFIIFLPQISKMIGW